MVELKCKFDLARRMAFGQADRRQRTFQTKAVSGAKAQSQDKWRDKPERGVCAGEN